MIEAIQLIRNIGTFDNVSSAQQKFEKATVIYAENGRGKTTISNILRSLGNNEPDYIEERKRLGATSTPHVVIQAGQSYLYQNGSWSTHNPNIVVFDDNFVAENICSGIQLDPRHRQNLHELVIGSQGVSLNRILQGKIAEIEKHNNGIRIISASIKGLIPNGITIDKFIALEEIEDLSVKIAEVEKQIKAVNQNDPIQKTPLFGDISIPEFNIDKIQEILGKGLGNLQSEAIASIQEHLKSLIPNSEKWIDEGVDILNQTDGENCPFCTQPLEGVDLIKSYQLYFSDEYSALKEEIIDLEKKISNENRTEVFTALERDLSGITKRLEFWGNYTDVPDIELGSIELIKAWKPIYEGILNKLRVKAKAPLEIFSLEEELVEGIKDYHKKREELINSVGGTKELNESIKVVKEKAKVGDLSALKNDLSNLLLVKKRYDADAITKCKEYTDAKEAKAKTEKERNEARENLDTYRNTIFPTYETSINSYLQKFNAGFRLQQMTSNNSRTGSSCNYNVLINNVEVSISSQNQGEPSFRSTLSAGDRNTLALAFFFSSLDLDQNKQNKVVVIDDPMSSLDAHRSLTTIQEIKKLIADVSQAIILSHSKPFLINLWQGLTVANKSALKIGRIADGSDIQDWDVSRDSITEHDKRYELIHNYLANPTGQNERDVAIALRPTLESYSRVCYPLDFPPGSLLGKFIESKLKPSENTPNQLMPTATRVYLRELLDYANRFHHDTNPTYQTEIINDQELSGFAQGVVDFIRK